MIHFTFAVVTQIKALSYWGRVMMQIGFWIAWLATQCTDATSLQAAPLSLIGVAPGIVYLYQAVDAASSKK